MTVFEHIAWPALAPYAKVTAGRGNVDLLQLPDDLRTLALSVVVHCVACGAPTRCFRARVKSKRARTPVETERRLFYSATCSAEVTPGCARSRAAKAHKKLWMKISDKGRLLPKWGDDDRAKVVQQLDAALQFAPKICREVMIAARALLVEG